MLVCLPLSGLVLMTTVSAKEVFVTWNGDLAQWPDYVRKVRFQWEKTPAAKRFHLGPELASRLTDKAWQATYDIDHGRLSGKYGVKYLIGFLRDKLCTAPVPDAGARLEDLLIRLRRSPGTPFAQWANEVRESYRRLQRALLRARAEAGVMKSPKKVGKSFRSQLGSASSEPERPPSERGDPSPTRSQRSQASAREADAAGASPEPDEPEPRSGDGDAQNAGSWYDRWSPAEWREWLRVHRDYGDDSTNWSYHDDDEHDPDGDVPWDELEVQDAEVLPEEVLGWLLLRRAGLSTASRLAVQASVGNSLRFDAIERALRDQEEELLAAERRPPGKGMGKKGSFPKRTFWVEEDKEWGLLDYEPDQDEIPVHWIGSKLPDEVYHVHDPEPQAVPDDDDSWWSTNVTWDDQSWPSSTAWWSEAESWVDSDLNSDEQKQLEEIHAAYEDKKYEPLSKLDRS